MADHTPIFKPGREITLTAGAGITGGKTLIVSDQETVTHAGGVDDKFVGISAFDAASGAQVGVISGGVHELAASGTINDGDLVTTAASGAVAAFSGTTYSTIIGIALADAANSLVKVKLFR